MTASPRDHGWHEVANRVFTRRYQPIDVTVTAILGNDGVAVVDTRCSLAEGREIREDLHHLSTAPVRWVVNTHAHWDHMWGNAEFVEPRLSPPAEIWGHRNLPAACGGDATEQCRKRISAWSADWAARLADLAEVVPDHLVDRRHTLDLGDRGVELLHLGRGHTDGDLVLHVSDADVLLAGDLVEQSGPPSYGSDSFPLEWPATIDAPLALAGTRPATIVPGHGDPIGIDFVTEQRAALGAVADEITRLHRADVAQGDAVAAGSWPSPWDDDTAGDRLGDAIACGYAAIDGNTRNNGG